MIFGRLFDCKADLIWIGEYNTDFLFGSKFSSFMVISFSVLVLSSQ